MIEINQPYSENRQVTNSFQNAINQEELINRRTQTLGMREIPKPNPVSEIDNTAYMALRSRSQLNRQKPASRYQQLEQKDDYTNVLRNVDRRRKYENDLLSKAAGNFDANMIGDKPVNEDSVQNIETGSNLQQSTPNHAITDFNEFQRNKESEINLVQGIEDKDFQEYLQSLKKVDDALKKEELKEASEEVPINEYQQEKEQGNNYNVLVSRQNTPIKKHIKKPIPRVEPPQINPQLMQLNEYNQNKKSSQYSVSVLPVNELSNQANVQQAAIEHMKTTTLPNTEYLSAEDDKLVRDTLNMANGQEKGVKNINAGLDSQASFEIIPDDSPLRQEERLPEPTLNRETNYANEATLKASSLRSEELSRQASASAKEQVQYPEEVGTQELPARYQAEFNAQRSASFNRQPIRNAFSRSEPSLPYPSQANEQANVNRYKQLKYENAAKKTVRPYMRATSYSTANKYPGMIPFSAVQNVAAQDDATSERLMRMTHNPSLLSQPAVSFKPGNSELHVKSAPLEKEAQDILYETPVENLDVADMIKTPFQDTSLFKTTAENYEQAKRKQYKKAMNTEIPLFDRFEATNYETPLQPPETSYRRTARPFTAIDRPVPVRPNRNSFSRMSINRYHPQNNYMAYRRQFSNEYVKNIIPKRNEKRNKHSTNEEEKSSLKRTKNNRIMHFIKKQKEKVLSHFMDLGASRAIEVAGSAKDKITTASRKELLKKLLATKEDLLADRKPNKESIEDPASSLIHHIEGSQKEITLNVIRNKHNEAEKAETSDTHPTKKSDSNNEMNIVEDEEVANRQQTTSDFIEHDKGDEKKLYDAIDHSRKTQIDDKNLSKNKQEKEIQQKDDPSKKSEEGGNPGVLLDEMKKKVSPGDSKDLKIKVKEGKTENAPPSIEIEITNSKPKVDIGKQNGENAKVEAKADGPIEGKLDNPIEGKADNPIEGKLDKPVEGKSDAPIEAKIEGKNDGKIEGKFDGKMEGKSDNFEGGKPKVIPVKNAKFSPSSENQKEDEKKIEAINDDLDTTKTKPAQLPDMAKFAGGAEGQKGEEKIDAKNDDLDTSKTKPAKVDEKAKFAENGEKQKEDEKKIEAKNDDLDTSKVKAAKLDDKAKFAENEGKQKEDEKKIEAKNDDLDTSKVKAAKLDDKAKFAENGEKQKEDEKKIEAKNDDLDTSKTKPAKIDDKAKFAENEGKQKEDEKKIEAKNDDLDTSKVKAAKLDDKAKFAENGEKQKDDEKKIEAKNDDLDTKKIKAAKVEDKAKFSENGEKQKDDEKKIEAKNDDLDTSKTKAAKLDDKAKFAENGEKQKEDEKKIEAKNDDLDTSKTKAAKLDDKAKFAENEGKQKDDEKKIEAKNDDLDTSKTKAAKVEDKAKFAENGEKQKGDDKKIEAKNDDLDTSKTKAAKIKEDKKFSDDKDEKDEDDPKTLTDKLESDLKNIKENKDDVEKTEKMLENKEDKEHSPNEGTEKVNDEKPVKQEKQELSDTTKNDTKTFKPTDDKSSTAQPQPVIVISEDKGEEKKVTKKKPFITEDAIKDKKTPRGDEDIKEEIRKAKKDRERKINDIKAKQEPAENAEKIADKDKNANATKDASKEVSKVAEGEKPEEAEAINEIEKGEKLLKEALEKEQEEEKEKSLNKDSSKNEGPIKDSEKAKAIETPKDEKEAKFNKESKDEKSPDPENNENKDKKASEEKGVDDKDVHAPENGKENKDGKDNDETVTVVGRPTSKESKDFSKNKDESKKEEENIDDKAKTGKPSPEETSGDDKPKVKVSVKLDDGNATEVKDIKMMKENEKEKPTTDEKSAPDPKKATADTSKDKTAPEKPGVFLPDEEAKKLKEATDKVAAVLALKEEKLKQSMVKLASSGNTKQEAEVAKLKGASLQNGSAAAVDPEEKKLKEMLNKKVEEIMQRFRKEKQSSKQTDDNAIPDGIKNEFQQEENKDNSKEDAKADQDGDASKEAKEETKNKPSTEKAAKNYDINDTIGSFKAHPAFLETDAGNNDVISKSTLKDDVDDYSNKTDTSIAKNVIESMPNPFADIGSISDSPMYHHDKKSDSESTAFDAHSDKEQQAAQRDTFPGIIDNRKISRFPTKIGDFNGPLEEAEDEEVDGSGDEEDEEEENDVGADHDDDDALNRNDDDEEYENDEKDKIASFEKDQKRSEDDNKGSSLIEEGTEVDAKDLPDVFGAKVRDSNDVTNVDKSRNDDHREEKSNSLISLFINQKDLKPVTDYSKSLEVNIPAQKKHITSLGSLKGHHRASHDTVRVLESDEESQFAPSPDQVENTLVAIDEMNPSQPFVSEEDSDVKVQDEENNIQNDNGEAKEKKEVDIEERPSSSDTEKPNYVSSTNNKPVKPLTLIVEKESHAPEDQKNQFKLSKSENELLKAAAAEVEKVNYAAEESNLKSSTEPEKTNYASTNENNEVAFNQLQQIPETNFEKPSSFTNNITVSVDPQQQRPEHHQRKDTTLTGSTINGNLVPYEENNQIVVNVPPVTDTFMTKSFSENKEDIDHNQKVTVSPAKEIATYFTSSNTNEVKGSKPETYTNSGNHVNTYRYAGDTVASHEMEKPGATFRHESLSQHDHNNEFGNIEDIIDNFGYPNEQSPFVIDYDEDKMEHFVESLEHEPEQSKKHKTKTSKKHKTKEKEAKKKVEKTSQHTKKAVSATKTVKTVTPILTALTSPINKHKGYYDMITYADYKKIIKTRNLTAIEGLMMSKTGHDKVETTSAVKKKEINKNVKAKTEKETVIQKGYAKLLNEKPKQSETPKKTSTLKKETTIKVLPLHIDAERINVKVKTHQPVKNVPNKVPNKNQTVTNIKIHVNSKQVADQLKTSRLKFKLQGHMRKGAKPVVLLNVIDAKNTKTSKKEKEKNEGAKSRNSGIKAKGKTSSKTVTSKDVKTNAIKVSPISPPKTAVTIKKPLSNTELNKSKPKVAVKSASLKEATPKVIHDIATTSSPKIIPLKKEYQSSPLKESPINTTNSQESITKQQALQKYEESSSSNRSPNILLNKTSAELVKHILPSKDVTNGKDTDASSNVVEGSASSPLDHTAKTDSLQGFGSGDNPSNHLASHDNLEKVITVKNNTAIKDPLPISSREKLLRNLEKMSKPQTVAEENNNRLSLSNISSFQRAKAAELIHKDSISTDTKNPQDSKLKLNITSTIPVKPARISEPSRAMLTNNDAIIVVAEPDDNKSEDQDTAEFKALEQNTKKLIKEVMSEKFAEIEGEIKSKTDLAKSKNVTSTANSKLIVPSNKLPKIIPKGYIRSNKTVPRPACDPKKQSAEKCNLLAAVKEYILEKKLLMNKTHPLIMSKKKTADYKKAMESKIILLGKSFLSLVSQFNKYDKSLVASKKKTIASKKTPLTSKKSNSNKVTSKSIKKDPVTGSKRGDNQMPFMYGGQQPQQLPIYFPPASVFQSYMKPLIENEIKKQARGRSPQLGDTSASIINSLEAFKYAANPFSSIFGNLQQQDPGKLTTQIKLNILPMTNGKHNLSVTPTGQKKLFLRPLTQITDKTDVQSHAPTTGTKPLLRSSPPRIEASKELKTKSNALFKLASTLKSKEFNQKLMAAKNEKAKQALLAKKQVWQNNVIAALKKSGRLPSRPPTLRMTSQLRPAKNISQPVNISKPNVFTLNTTKMLPISKISNTNATDKNTSTAKPWKNQIYLSAGILAKLNQYTPEKLLEMINTNSLPTFLDGNETGNYSTNLQFNPVQKIVRDEKGIEKGKNLKESNIESLGLKSWKFIPLSGSDSIIPSTKGFMFSPVIQTVVKNKSVESIPKDQYVIKSISDYVHLNAANILQKKIKNTHTLDTIGKPKIEAKSLDRERQYRQSRNRGVQLWKQFINLAEALRDTAGRNIRNIDSKTSVNPHIFFPVKRINNLMRPSTDKSYDLGRKVSVSNKDNGESIVGLSNKGADKQNGYEGSNMFSAKDNVVQSSKENDIQKLVDNIQTTNNLITQLFGKEINGDKDKKAAVTVSTTPAPTQSTTTLDPEVMKFKDLLTKKVDQMVEEFAKRKQAGR